MRYIGGGIGSAQYPSLLRWAVKHMNQLVPAIMAACVFGATATMLPAVALAQSAEHGAAPIAPALNLEDVAAASGLPGLTVTNALGRVAHLFPTVPAALCSPPATGIWSCRGRPRAPRHPATSAKRWCASW